MSVQLEITPKRKRPPGDPCTCSPALPSIDDEQAERLVSIAKALADPVRLRLVDAETRLDAALAALGRAGIDAKGRVDIGAPMRCLVDGLREFPATEVVMLEGGERGWEDAERFAARVRTEIGLPVKEVETGRAALVAA